MEGEKQPDNEERRTRSGRSISGGGKRKRNSTDSETDNLRLEKSAKMGNEEDSISVQLDNLRQFLGNKIDNAQKLTNENLAAITKRMDKNEHELNAHKAQTQSDIAMLKISLEAVTTSAGRSAGGATPSYADACLLYTSPSPRDS